MELSLYKQEKPDLVSHPYRVLFIFNLSVPMTYDVAIGYSNRTLVLLQQPGVNALGIKISI